MGKYEHLMIQEGSKSENSMNETKNQYYTYKRNV